MQKLGDINTVAEQDVVNTKLVTCDSFTLTASIKHCQTRDELKGKLSKRSLN